HRHVGRGLERHPEAEANHLEVIDDADSNLRHVYLVIGNPPATRNPDGQRLSSTSSPPTMSRRSWTCCRPKWPTISGMRSLARGIPTPSSMTAKRTSSGKMSIETAARE